MEAEEYCRKFSDEFLSRFKGRFRLSLKMALLLRQVCSKQTEMISKRLKAENLSDQELTSLINDAELLQEFIQAADAFFLDAQGRDLSKNN